MKQVLSLFWKKFGAKFLQFFQMAFENGKILHSPQWIVLIVDFIQILIQYFEICPWKILWKSK